MAAPTNPALVKKTLANSEPSTHCPSLPRRPRASVSVIRCLAAALGRRPARQLADLEADAAQADMAGQMAAAAASEKMMVPSFERRRPARRPRQWCSGPGPAARLVVLSARGPGIL